MSLPSLDAPHGQSEAGASRRGAGARRARDRHSPQRQDRARRARAGGDRRRGARPCHPRRARRLDRRRPAGLPPDRPAHRSGVRRVPHSAGGECRDHCARGLRSGAQREDRPLLGRGDSLGAGLVPAQGEEVRGGLHPARRSQAVDRAGGLPGVAGGERGPGRAHRLRESGGARQVLRWGAARCGRRGRGGSAGSHRRRGASAPTLPKVVPPPAPAPGGAAAKKKKEGC